MLVCDIALFGVFNFHTAAIHSTNAEKLLLIMKWEQEPNLPKEKKQRIQLYLDRFLSSADEADQINPQDLSFSVLERYLLLIDWLKESPETVQLIKKDHELLGENSAFKLNTFYTSDFKNVPNSLKPVLTEMYLASNPKWSVKEFKRKCTAIPKRSEAQELLEKTVAEAIQNKVDETAVKTVCTCTRDVTVAVFDVFCSGLQCNHG